MRLSPRFLELFNGTLNVAGLQIEHAQLVAIHQIVGVTFDEAFGVRDLDLIQFGLQRSDFVAKSSRVRGVRFELGFLGVDFRFETFDFGLGNFSNEIEDMGVDLLLLNRSMRSTHYLFHTELFKSFIKGYSDVIGPKCSNEIVEKMREIERRGRYFERG